MVEFLDISNCSMWILYYQHISIYNTIIHISYYYIYILKKKHYIYIWLLTLELLTKYICCAYLTTGHDKERPGAFRGVFRHLFEFRNHLGTAWHSENWLKGNIYKVGPPFDSVQLVHITPITMVYGTYNYSIHGVYKPSNITGGPRILWSHLFLFNQIWIFYWDSNKNGYRCWCLLVIL